MKEKPEIYEVHIDSFKDKPVLAIPTGGGWDMKIGLTKCKAILDHIKEINNFVESNGKTIDEP